MLGLLQHRAYKRAIAGRLDGSAPGSAVPNGGKSQKIITRAMFALMGRLAKTDGLVTADEVRYATSIMQLLDLNSRERQEAIDYFDLGKQLDTDIFVFINELVNSVGRRSSLAQLFVKLQCRLTYVKGGMRLKEKVLLRDVAESLGFDKAEFLQICRSVCGTADTRPGSWKPLVTEEFVSNAYGVLQLEPDVEDGEIRRAYLRLMSRYHPDKLMRDNISEETLRLAQEKSAAIRTAYEEVCGFRKIRA